MTCDAKFHVKPQLAKGKIIITNGEYIGTHKLLWLNADTGTKEEECLLLPNLSKFTKVKASKDRVYMLCSTGENRFFYYMQEEDTTKDDENAAKINQIINTPMTQNPPQHNTDSVMRTEEPHDTHQPHPRQLPVTPEMLQALGIMQQMQGQGHNHPRVAQNPVHNPNQNQQLAQLLSNPQLLQAMMSQMRIPEYPSLNEIVNPDIIKEVENNPLYEKALMEFLPKEQQSREGFIETLHSPQFIQALECLEIMAGGGQYGSLLLSLGLNPADVQNVLNGVEALVTAIMKKYPPQQNNP